MIIHILGDRRTISFYQAHAETAILCKEKTFSNRSERYQFLFDSLGAVIGLKVEDLGIQGSSKTLMEEPSLILHRIPDFSNSLAHKRLLQIIDGLLPIRACIISWSGKYRPLRISPAKEFGFWIKHQTCLASIAWLITPKSRKPIPPSLLEFHSKSGSQNLLME